MSNSRSKGTALITGASAGIGAVYADRLAKRGYDLILVARNELRLKSLAARLKSETGRSVKVLRADLGNKAELAEVEATLRDDPSITLLVNNAGAASVAPLLTADVDKMEEIIALNVTALTRLAYAAAPAFVSRGAGTIINIGSIVGISPETLNGVYGASKAYVIAFSQSLDGRALHRKHRRRLCRRRRHGDRAEGRRLHRQVAVTDNQNVHAGDLLVKLDDRDYRAALAAPRRPSPRSRRPGEPRRHPAAAAGA
jgi:NADP-dependent 3-hydroxy acid dehydrogenase YdfG